MIPNLKNFMNFHISFFQLQYGEDDDIKSFLLELTWGDNYPNDPPTINMDTFYNRNMWVENNFTVRVIWT